MMTKNEKPMTPTEVLEFLQNMQAEMVKTMQHLTGYKVSVQVTVYDVGQETGELFTAACREGWEENAKDGHVWAWSPRKTGNTDGVSIHYHLIPEENNASPNAVVVDEQ